MINFKIDEEKCIHCGLCIKDCMAQCISFDENKIPQFDETGCYKCQHCMAVCPVGALSILDKNPENSDKVLNVEPEKVLNVIKSRRSVRHYKKENLAPEKMEKLKDMLNWVPTGCNDHRLHFSFIDDIEVMNEFRDYVNEKIKFALTKTPVKALAKKFQKRKEGFLKGDDIVFRGAPHMLVVSSPVNAPCYNIDPMIALSYFELYAHSLNVGTCWCGLAEACILLIPELSEYLEIPDNYKATYVMLFGEPDIKYTRTVQPEKYEMISVKKKGFKKVGLTKKVKRFFWNLK